MITCDFIAASTNIVHFAKKLREASEHLARASKLQIQRNKFDSPQGAALERCAMYSQEGTFKVLFRLRSCFGNDSNRVTVSDFIVVS